MQDDHKDPGLKNYPIIEMNEVDEMWYNNSSCIQILFIGFLFLAIPVSGEAINAMNQSGPYEYHVPGYGIEHTSPHPYLISNLNEKLKQIQSGIPGNGSEEIDPVITNTESSYIIKPGLRSIGENRLLVILVDFPDKTHGPNQTREEAMAGFNGPGTPGSFPPHDSVNGFYARSSYGKLNLTADVYGWYTAPHERQYYEQMHSVMYGTGWWELTTDCLDAFDGEIDYTRYDNDNDGDIDNVYIIWAGSDFNEFWGGCCGHFGGVSTETWDGLTLDSIVWEPYSYGGPDSPFCPMVTNHETGHLLGLPDYYDYDPSVGPRGGVGRFDLMDGNMVDHNCFSKYMLDWIDPVVITGGEQTLHLNPSSSSPDAVIIMPNGSGGPYTDFYMVQARNPAIGNDNCTLLSGWWYNPYKSGEWLSPGLAIWHVDDSMNYDNSYTTHKMLRLMEADGLEDIERSITHEWDPKDLYYSGQLFGLATSPNSSRYDGSETGIQIDQISQEGTGMDLRIKINPLIIPPLPPASTSGVYRPGSGFYLKMDNGDSWYPSTDRYLAWDTAVQDLPVAGDWNGDGKDETGVYRPGSGFYLKMDKGNTWNPLTDRYLAWDNAVQDLPVAGDWNGDEKDETGVYRPGTGFYLKMENGNSWNPSTDRYLAWDNAAEDRPIAGDWNGDGIDETGVYRPGVGFYVKIDNGNFWNPSTDRYLAWDNAAEDLPIAGDWNGDGIDETGVYRPGVGFYLKMDNGNSWNPLTDRYLAWDNAAGDRPIAGNFV